MKYESNINQVVLEMKGRLLSAQENSALLRTMGTYLKASNLERIHMEGKGVNEGLIGQYDTDPMYVNPKKSPRKFPPMGKTGRTKFKSGKPHKTKYFAQGYKGFRAAVGRDATKVNLHLTGTLLKSFVMEQDGNDIVLGFNSEYGSDVSAGNEQRFGKKIWGVTQKDIKQLEKIGNDFVNKKMKK